MLGAVPFHLHRRARADVHVPATRLVSLINAARSFWASVVEGRVTWSALKSDEFDGEELELDDDDDDDDEELELAFSYFSFSFRRCGTSAAYMSMSADDFSCVVLFFLPSFENITSFLSVVCKTPLMRLYSASEGRRGRNSRQRYMQAT
jgi:hypothetical protein